MLHYKNLNVNPKGRKTGDCSTRALVGCLGLKYDDVLDLQLKFVKKYYLILAMWKWNNLKNLMVQNIE